MVAKAVEHHDHIKDYPNYFMREKHGQEWIKCIPPGFGEFLNRIEILTIRFRPTVVCEDCNNAESTAKKFVSAPTYFSFAPSEIRQFIVSSSNSVHGINQAQALHIFNEALPSFNIRIAAMTRLIEGGIDGRWWSYVR